MSAYCKGIALIACLGLFAPAMAGDDEPKPPVEAKAALDALKTLVGTWEGEEEGQKYTITYRLSGAGSVLIETMFPGTDYEMISMYHLDRDDLRMTHYCAAGNQPHLKLDREASTAKSLVFEFDGGTNLDPAKDMHVHEGKVELVDADHFQASWTGYHNGKATNPHVFKLTRKKD